ncbi:glycosyl transferase [Sporanaerobium hydrogeniformans]|uniref:Glycosyl transferase n=1 Tax=Sporanaerobium hydrogeniformans TaxID=3072179 RepID=A0AC61DAZ0_9FIRM|nr:glycosyltransferase [Sporanaerobium hydrogeniformans]PHV70429.1 glycosyl transferase [Sporanaerobium hydrogeniformans]
MANIILVTHWTGGDVIPFIKLGYHLKNEGHEVTLFTHCEYELQAKEKKLDFVALDNPELYKQMNEELYQLADPINKREECIEFQLKYHGKERLLAEYEKIVPYCNKPETIILARHRSSVSGLLVAEKLKLPYASVVLAPNYFSHMDLHDKIFGQELIKEINKVRMQLDLPQIKSWKNWLYSPKSMWGIWPEWFASKTEDWPQGVSTIGFFEQEIDENELFDPTIERLLETTEPIVLISGGSSEMVSPRFYEVAVKACEQAGFRGILVTKYERLVPKDLPSPILWVKQIHLVSLMRRVNIIIHHGGMGTLNEAISAGIPQIIMPHLTDGPDNAERLVKLGIAKSFAKARWDSDLIAEAIVTSLQPEVIEKCRYYQEQNEEIYKQRRWVKLINEIKPYEGIIQEPLEKVQLVKKKEVLQEDNRREQLLAIIKRKRKE